MTVVVRASSRHWAPIAFALPLWAWGCGDAVLPSDYAGPPASAVAGNVVASLGLTKDADHPRLSVEWLSSLDASNDASTALIGQDLRFVRSSKLATDWDIGLALPLDRATLAFPSSNVKASVGKMVYYDDRLGDGKLDWHCTGSTCDLVKSVSADFVVFVQSPPVCTPSTGGPARARVPSGYHYYRMEGGRPVELGADEPVSFVVTDESLSESNPSGDLRAFATALQSLWGLLNPFDGC